MFLKLYSNFILYSSEELLLIILIVKRYLPLPPKAALVILLLFNKIFSHSKAHLFSILSKCIFFFLKFFLVLFITY